ncbi:MAG: phosphopantothenoylcysteine decarboxylase [Elusimicrobiales bacterium]
MRILVVSGATREYIDGVRFITNFSTGATGAVLARHFSRGHEVLLLRGEAARPAKGVREIIFSDFTDLGAKLKKLLRRRFGMVVMCAAVSDYSVAAIRLGGRRLLPAQRGKLPSGSGLEIKLKPNFKLLDKMPEWSAGKPLIAGFKLTDDASPASREAAARKVSSRITVQNDMRDIRAGIRRFNVYENGVLAATCAGAQSLARKLQKLGEKHAARP